MTGFEAFAIVELMGHARIAGKVSEAELFGTALMRVDVPKTQSCEGFTKYYSAGSIYCITPTDEATAQLAAEKFEEKPVQAWVLPTSPILAEKVTSRFDDDEDEEDYGYDGDGKRLPGWLDVEDETDHFGEDENFPDDEDETPLITPTSVAVNSQSYEDELAALPGKERAIRRSKDLMQRKFVLFDLETTTTNFKDTSKDEIVQIAIIDQAGTVLLNSYVKPTVKIPNSNYHGITDEMVKDAPTFPELYPQIEAALTGNLWLVYNLDYDGDILYNVCKRHDLTALGASNSVCVMRLFAAYYGEWADWTGDWKFQKLSTAMNHFKLAWEGKAHDALADCKATLEVLKALAAVEPEKKAE